MAVKVMGITAGRKDSNSEILLKEALMYCEEAGADVTMINLKDYHIESCTGCTSCTRGMAQGKHTGCVLDEKDDKKKIMEVMLDQDAVIFSAPTYDLMPNAEYLIFAQRSLSYETAFLETIGAIDHKDRVAGLICAGGSTRAWQSMALEAMQATMFTTDMKVVDMILAILFFVKVGTSYFEYRKHGQFEFAAPCILFACLIFTLTAPLYIWSIL